MWHTRVWWSMTWVQNLESRLQILAETINTWWCFLIYLSIGGRNYPVLCWWDVAGNWWNSWGSRKLATIPSLSKKLYRYGDLWALLVSFIWLKMSFFNIWHLNTRLTLPITFTVVQIGKPLPMSLSPLFLFYALFAQQFLVEYVVINHSFLLFLSLIFFL